MDFTWTYTTLKDLLEWGVVGSPHGNSFHGAYFGAETGGGPGIRWDPMGSDGIVPGGFR